MDYTSENRQRIVDYLKAGAHDECSLLGLEIEHFIISADGTEPMYYRSQAPKPGVEDVLEYLSKAYPERVLGEFANLIGLSGDDAAISLEPASQIEISIAPYARISDIEAAYKRFRDTLDPVLKGLGYELVSLGYNPIRKALDMPLYPKLRYKFMDEYFTEIGTHGHRMMRASAATQVSIDYSSEADAIRKARVANAIAPVLGAICDNAPVFEGEPNTKPLTRLLLWRDVDNARCRVIPGLYDDDFDFGKYADWLLGTRPIFVTRAAADDPDGKVLRPDGGKTAAEIYADAPMEEGDIEHLMSMFWPDVRVKHFVEIRPVDSLPAELALGYTALIKGLFYSVRILAAVEKAVGVDDGTWPINEQSIEDAILAIRKDGLKADVYGLELGEWEDLLFSLAAAALPRDERHYLAPLREFAHDKIWTA